MTRFAIDQKILTDFPAIFIGVVRFHDIDNTGKDAEIMAALKEEEARIVQRFQGVALTEHPHIAPWRDAYRKFGAKPKDYPSSIENLVRRVLKGHSLPHINQLVDIYNAISLRHILPVGGEDLDQISGDVRLVYASAEEAPVLLLGETEPRPPKLGEVIYKDDTGAICRRWNWKEADRTKFTERTRNGFLVIEGLPPVEREVVQHATAKLADLVQKYCGGRADSEMLDANNVEIALT